MNSYCLLIRKRILQSHYSEMYSRARITILCLYLFHVNILTAEIATEPVVELRWDFTDCGQSGRFGPTQEQCDLAYKDTNLEGDVEVVYGVQIWEVPVTGLYLVTAKGPAGSSPQVRGAGKGAVLTSEFQMTEGQRIKLLVGQQSDFNKADVAGTSVGGSGGTFIVRESDQYILMVAGGGSSGAGTKWNDWSITTDATLLSTGRNSSKVGKKLGHGGNNQSGGNRGTLAPLDDSSSGGGAGYGSDGESGFVDLKRFSGLRSRPRSSKSFTFIGVSDKAPGVGGYFMYIDENGRPIQNNGGFGGGGSGSNIGGSGGGGGFSGGGGGPSNGWGGGGGSFNNGGRQRNSVTNRGTGSVIISFIGHQCCGPVVVYIAMTFIAGVLITILVGFAIIRLSKAVSRYDGSDVEMFQRAKRKFRSAFERKKNVHGPENENK